MINIFKSKHRKMVDKWKKDLGDATLRYNYPLNKDSIVFDIGGYKGVWTNSIYWRYGCKIHIFEPIHEFFNIIEKRFSKNKDIITHKFALGNCEKLVGFYIDNYSSSMYGKGKTKDVMMVDIIEFLNDNRIKKIDLMKINIEGGEYKLLEHLIVNDYIKNIKDIQVQFHNIIPFAKQRRENIRMQLEKTHYQTYNYPFVWENWRRKDGN